MFLTFSNLLTQTQDIMRGQSIQIGKAVSSYGRGQQVRLVGQLFGLSL
jgi:hypothetical protein